MSDPDKLSVYRAEEMTFEGTVFTDPLHTEEFIDLAILLFEHFWWSDNSIPTPAIKPTTKRDSSSYARIYHSPSAAGDDREPVLHIAPNQIDVHTLAHEAAHVAQYYLFPVYLNPRLQSHGKEFRATYLIVASILLGYDAAEALAENLSRFIPDHSWRWYQEELQDYGRVGIYQKWCLERSMAALNDLKKAFPTSGPIAL